MILLDVNLLLYAYDSSSKNHSKAKNWWESKLSQAQPVALPWTTILAFLRIVTNPRILTSPLDIAEASEIVQSWLERPMVFIPAPTEQHWIILKKLLIESQSPANHVPDAHLAALAIEHGALLCSSDRDFLRYNELRWENPMA